MGNSIETPSFLLPAVGLKAVFVNIKEIVYELCLFKRLAVAVTELSPYVFIQRISIPRQGDGRENMPLDQMDPLAIACL